MIIYTKIFGSVTRSVTSFYVTRFCNSKIPNLNKFNIKCPRYGGIQLLSSDLGGRGTNQNANVSEARGGGGSCQCECSPIIYLFEHLISKLLPVITRFFICFINIHVLLKIYFEDIYISFVSKIANQLRLLGTIMNDLKKYPFYWNVLERLTKTLKKKSNIEIGRNCG